MVVRVEVAVILDSLQSGAFLCFIKVYHNKKLFGA